MSGSGIPNPAVFINADPDSAIILNTDPDPAAFLCGSGSSFFLKLKKKIAQKLNSDRIFTEEKIY